MRRLVLLACVVPLLAACGSSSGGSGVVPDGPIASVPHWVVAENLPQRAVAGAKLFAVAGCTACHTYMGSGKQVLNAPDLTSIGSRDLGIAFEIRHLKCPECAIPGSPMPRFDELGPKRLRQLAIFLEASKGTR